MQRTFLRGAAVVAAIGIVVALTGCGGGGKKAAEVRRVGVKGEGVAIEVPDALAGKVTGKAVPAQVLGLMPGVNAKVVPLAAAEFEPSGTEIPDGARVTWNLSKKQSPGTDLWVVEWDPVLRKWCGTDEKAKVDSSGARASGLIYHFSPPVGVTDCAPVVFAPSGKPIPLDPSGKFTTDPLDEIKRPRRKVRISAYKPDVIDKAKREAGIRAYDEIVRAKGPNGMLDLNDYKRLTKTTDYAVVKSLIEDGTISKQHNYQLADWRIYVLVDGLRTVLKDMPGVKVYRSDTGNQKNAYLSDVDQTLVAYKQQPNGEWVRWPEGDVVVKGKLLGHLSSQGLPPARMEVETMPGRDRFIDERLVSADLGHSLPDEIAGKPRDVIISYANVGLSSQPGAYFLAGTVKQLMQMRIADQASKHLQGPIQPDPRPIVVPQVKELIGRLNGQVCTEIAPAGPASKAILVREGSCEDARRALMDGLEPALQRGWAYDAAVDSHIKFNEKLKYTLDPGKTPPVKHLLRCVDYGMGMVARLDGKTPHTEYALLNDAERMEYLKSAFGADLAQPRPDRLNGTGILDRWKEALDISAKLRNVTDREERPVTQADLDEAFQSLAGKKAGPGNEARWKEFLGQARLEYNQRCQEILTHSMVAASKERIEGWLTVDAENPSRREDMTRHIDEPEIRRALRLTGPEHDAKWASIRKEIFTNFADTARVQLMYSFRYMAPEMVELIIRRAEGNPKLSPADVVKIRELARTAQHPLFHFFQYPKFPKLYHQIVREWARFKAENISRRVVDHLLLDIGYIDTSAARHVPNPLFKSLGLGGVDAAVHEFFKAHNTTAGFGMRFVKNTVINPGNVGGIGQVLRDWSESRGDPEVIQEAIIRETVSAMPFVGQVVSFASCRNVKEFAATAAQMAAAIWVPGAGQLMLVYGLGKTGVAIYESDYRAPMAHAVADTLYRGFCGPSLYNFGSAPAQFTDADAAELSQVKSDLRVMRMSLASDDSKVGLLMRERVLLEKKERWNGYVIEQSRNEGGTLTGTAAQLVQKPLELEGNPEFPDEPKWMGGPMLARVTPVVLFTATREGPVDFDAKPLTDAERTTMDQLQRQAGTEEKSPKQFEIAAEIEKLASRQEAYDRAQRYLERAKTNRELIHQIRMDSLWPCMLRDGSHDMDCAPKFVDDWMALRRQKIVDALGKLGIQADYQALRDAKEELTTRFEEDVQRSRERWEQFERFRRGREALAEQHCQSAQTRSHVEALMMWVENKTSNFSAAVQGAFAEAGLDPEYTAGLEYLGEAIVNRHRPISTPDLRIGATILKGDPDAASDEAKKDRFRPSVRVTADPDVFVQPYSYSVHQLNRDAVKSAVATRACQGLPLDDEMIKTLQEYLKQMPEPKKKGDPQAPAFLVFAWCKDFKLPDRVVPLTAADVPLLGRYTVPGGTGQAYLFGGAAFWAELQHVDQSPFRIETRRPKLRGDSTEIVVTSDTLRVLDLAESKSHNTTVKYSIYAGLSKDGPWEMTRDAGFSAGHEYSKIVPEKEGQSSIWKRVAENKVVLEDEFLGNVTRRMNWPVIPIWYRVGEKVILDFNDKEAKEAFSEPVGPGVGFIHLDLPYLQKPESEMHEFPGKEYHVKKTELGLRGGPGPANQNCVYRGARLVVRDGSRVYHFWTPRAEGKVMFDAGYDGDRLSMADVRLLLPPSGTTLKFEGDGEDAAATRTLPVVVDFSKEDLAQRQNQLKNDDGARKTMTDMGQGDARRMRGFIDRDNRILAGKPAAIKTYGDAADYVEAERDKIGCEGQLKACEECLVPASENRFARGKARMEGDWAAELAGAQAVFDVQKKLAGIHINTLTQQRAVLQAAYALPGPPGNAPQILRDYDGQIANAKTEFAMWMHDNYGWLCASAVDAADGAALRRFYDAAVEAFTERARVIKLDPKQADRDLGGLLMNYAKDLVLVTGDRTGAAALYTRGYRLAGEKPAIEQRDRLPAWWPVGDGGTPHIPPPPKPADAPSKPVQ